MERDCPNRGTNFLKRVVRCVELKESPLLCANPDFSVLGLRKGTDFTREGKAKAFGDIVVELALQR